MTFLGQVFLNLQGSFLNFFLYKILPILHFNTSPKYTSQVEISIRSQHFHESFEKSKQDLPSADFWRKA